MGILNIDKERPENHTPKTLDADGNSTIPSSYEIEEMVLINEDGVEEENFSKIVSSIKIVEEIYSPIITCKISVSDDDDFFQRFKISGKEILKLTLTKKTSKDQESIDLTLVSLEYPTYAKSADGIHIQEYDIVFITPFGYFSKIQTMSQSIEGNIFDIVKDLYENKLGVPKENILVEGTCPHKIKTVITKKTPLQSISWVLSKAFSDEGGSEFKFSPFFMWQTINTQFKDKILITSWEKILNAEAEGDPYVYKKFFEDKPGTPEYQDGVLQTIISFSSSLKLNKLNEIDGGGYGSQLNVFEYDKNYIAAEEVDANLFIPAEEFNNPIYAMDKFQSQVSNILKNQRDKSKTSITSNGSLGNVFALASKNSKKENNNNIFGGIISSATSVFKDAIINDAFKAKSLSRNKDLFLHKPAPLYQDLAPGTLTTIDIKEIYRQRELFFKSLSENISHSCSLYGDFKLNPGRKITINIPAAEGATTSDGSTVGSTDLDSDLSGDYTIAVAIHIFKNGEYTTKLKLIKPLQTKK
jgi:hypothetical protein